MLKFRVRTKQTLAARHIECPVPYSVQTEEPGGARVRHAKRSRFILRITTTNGVMDEATLQPMEPLVKPKSTEADYAMLDWRWGVFKARRAVFFDKDDRETVYVHPDCHALERSKEFQEWAWHLLKQAHLETAQSYYGFSL